VILGRPKGDNREYDKKENKDNGNSEQGLFQTALGAIDRIGLAKNAPEPSSLYLKQHC